MSQYFIVDTERVSQQALLAAFTDADEAFMNDGMLMLAYDTDLVGRAKKIQEAVWRVNNGAYCNVRELSGDQFDAYC